jgi:uncharacterized protein
VKLPLREPQLEALLAELTIWDGYVSSALLGLEAIRACARYGEEYASEARALLGDLALIPIDGSLLDQAASLGPTTLRSLDALHLATALSVRDELAAFVSYDRRLANAAKAHGLNVIWPQ